MRVEDIIKLIYADKQLKALKEKIDAGLGTFLDTAAYCNRSAELLGRYFSESVLEMSDVERVVANDTLLRDRYKDINDLLDKAQRAADKRAGISLQPRHAEYNAERADQIGQSLTDKTVPDETIQRRAKSAPANMTRSMQDDFVEENAEFRSSAGLKCYIVRISDGEPCEWCDKLAGRYEYGSEPDDVYHRHDNCGCVVTYENGRQRQNVWTKKNWEVPKEDAGAPESVRFTQEQAAAAGAEKPRVFSQEEAKTIESNKIIKSITAEERKELLSQNKVDIHNSAVDKSTESGIIKSGAVSGALDYEGKDSEKAKAHAIRYYDAVRKMTTDVKRIAENTGFSEELVQSIKDFVFNEKHDLGDKYDYFVPDYKMAQSWQRLIEGKHIQKHDLTLLYHEKMERELMKQGYSQDEAHGITSKKYNFAKEAEEYYDKIKRNKKK